LKKYREKLYNVGVMKKEIALSNKKLIQNIEELIIKAKTKTATAVNTVMVYTYYSIGKMIIEYEQKGKNRAGYGEATIKNLSLHLTKRFGKGWTKENLKLMRRFFIIYSQYFQRKKIKDSNWVNTVYPIEYKKENNDVKFVNSVYKIDNLPKFTLSWSHYLNIDENRKYKCKMFLRNRML